ncbi:MAG: hypothetical protein KDB23_06380, partial [Planctomycetales bacterium]|nr:hypothetical protein [Planctomycetales bacterium]
PASPEDLSLKLGYDADRIMWLNQLTDEFATLETRTELDLPSQINIGDATPRPRSWASTTLHCRSGDVWNVVRPGGINEADWVAKYQRNVVWKLGQSPDTVSLNSDADPIDDELTP